MFKCWHSRACWQAGLSRISQQQQVLGKNHGRATAPTPPTSAGTKGVGVTLYCRMHLLMFVQGCRWPQARQLRRPRRTSQRTRTARAAVCKSASFGFHHPLQFSACCHVTLRRVWMARAACDYGRRSLMMKPIWEPPWSLSPTWTLDSHKWLLTATSPEPGCYRLLLKIAACFFSACRSA